MSPRTLRRLPWLLSAASLVAGLSVAATARPVVAAGNLGAYSLTFSGTAAGRGGGVGASGGLVTFSGGPCDVSGRLDAAPSSAAQASSIEPGTMYRLVAGQVNAQAGEQVLGEPTTARAEFPGDTTEADATQADSGDTGVLRVVGGQGQARAVADSAAARAAVADFVAGAGQEGPPVVRIAGAFGDGRAVADEGAGALSAAVEVGAARVEVLDQLVLHDVVGTAEVAATGDDRTATAGFTIGAASVAGTPVVIGEDGVVVAGDPAVPGADVEALTEQVNAVLVDAGIEVRLLGARETSEGSRVAADSGGLGIRVTTPATQGVPRNDLELVLGRATATLFAEPAAPPPATAPVVTPSPSPAATSTPTATTPTAPSTTTRDAPPTSTGVSLPAPRAGTAMPPQVAPEEPATSAPTASPAMVVAGARMSPRTAYAGFAAWLLFTSTIPMLGAFWLRRRGLA